MCDNNQGILYLCPTPIGNMEDVSLRVIKVLREADLVACEDTRRAKILLLHYSISQPLISYHEHNEAQRVPQLLDELRQGKKIALISDAGTPAISDPGFRLVKAAIKEGYKVISLPGPCAFVTALVASGIAVHPCSFYGFLPRKEKERRQLLSMLALEENTIILYESPHHLQKTIKDLKSVLGDDRAAVWGRELTKVYEEYCRGTLGQLEKVSAEIKPRGEYVIIIAGGEAAAPNPEQDFMIAADRLMQAGFSVRDTAAAVSAVFGIPRNRIYKRILEKK